MVVTVAVEACKEVGLPPLTPHRALSKIALGDSGSGGMGGGKIYPLHSLVLQHVLTQYR